MSDIYLSYHRSDQAKATKIAQILSSNGMLVKSDMDMKAGEISAKTAEYELANATNILVLLSRQSVQSHWVMDEASFAAKTNKLIPALIEDVDPSALPQFLSNYQFIHLLDIDEDSSEFQRLVQAIQLRSSQARRDSGDESGEAPQNAGLYDGSSSNARPAKAGRVGENEPESWQSYLRTSWKAFGRVLAAFRERTSRFDPIISRLAVASGLITFFFATFSGIDTQSPLGYRTSAAFVAFGGPEGELSVVPGPGATAIVYEDGTRPVGVIRGHAASIVEAAFVDDDSAIVTVDKLGNARKTALAGLGLRSMMERKPSLTLESYRTSRDGIGPSTTAGNEQSSDSTASDSITVAPFADVQALNLLRALPISHEVPSTAQIDREFTVELVVDASRDQELNEIVGGVSPEAAEALQDLPSIQVVASGEAFTVEWITPPIQRLSSTTENVWRWRVTPNSMGRQEHLIEVFAYYGPEVLPIRTFRDSVNVEVSITGQALRSARSLGPLTIIAGLIGFLVIVLLGIRLYRRTS